jgi:hypothetical protein
MYFSGLESYYNYDFQKILYLQIGFLREKELSVSEKEKQVLS